MFSFDGCLATRQNKTKTHIHTHVIGAVLKRILKNKICVKSYHTHHKTFTTNKMNDILHLREGTALRPKQKVKRTQTV